MTIEQIDKKYPRHSNDCMPKRNQGENVATYLQRIEPDMDSVTCARCKRLYDYLHDLTHKAQVIGL